jgi:ABC-type uncharacterized transport system permease subunit
VQFNNWRKLHAESYFCYWLGFDSIAVALLAKSNPIGSFRLRCYGELYVMEQPDAG